METIQVTKAKPRRKIKAKTFPSELKETPEQRKFEKKAQSSAKNNEGEDVPKKKSIRKKRTNRSRKLTIEAARSDNTDDSNSLSIPERDSSWESMAKNPEIGDVNQNLQMNERGVPYRPMNHIKAKVDTGMGNRGAGSIAYPRSSCPITNPGTRFNQPREYNRLATQNRSSLSRQFNSDSNKQVDLLVSSLACIIPPCRSESQANLVVESFAEAFKQKVMARIVTDKANPQHPRGSNVSTGQFESRRPVSYQHVGSRLMDPTEAWVAHCKNNVNVRAVGESSRAQNFKNQGPRRPDVSQPLSAPVLARRFGSMNIQEGESEDQSSKSDSDREEETENVGDDLTTSPQIWENRMRMHNPMARRGKHQSKFYRRRQ